MLALLAQERHDLSAALILYAKQALNLWDNCRDVLSTSGVDPVGMMWRVAERLPHMQKEAPEKALVSLAHIAYLNHKNL